VKEKMTKREQMQACRDSLPIYPYRDSLLAAVDEHQVIIIIIIIVIIINMLMPAPVIVLHI
jgi:hypothetical protein